MKTFKPTLLAAAAAALTMTFAPVSLQAQQGQPTVPVEVWALRDVVNTVQVSPGGTRLLVHKSESKEGEYVLEVYELADLSKPPLRFNADPMEIIGARWITDNLIFGNAWQQTRKKIFRPEEDSRDYTTFSLNVDDKKFKNLEGNFIIENMLPDEPDTVLVRETRENEGSAIGVDPFEQGRPREYYRFNLDTGSKSLVLKGNEKFPVASFDNQGNPRYTRTLDYDTREYKNYYRNPGDSSWTQFGDVTNENDHDQLYRIVGGILGFAGFSADDPNIGYMIDNRGGDKAGLWEFNFSTGEFVRELFRPEDADVVGTLTHSIPGDDSLVAAVYPGAKYERHWFDEEEKALYEMLESQIPNAHQVSISSRSRDGSTMVVTNRGPKDPGSFWLVRDGKMTKLGSRNPLLTPDVLADVEYIRYPARDGKIIPAYVTKPKGDGPHPLIVLPHGGPHVTEVISYDEWGQLLANAGYMVLQPQYRMSTGWGQEHFDSAYGQHGLAMQDDKDDGAMYLVEQGLVDPDRIAMFGWSYGGYAALVAASREPNIYQCTIAGAAVADAEKVYKKRSRGRIGKAVDDWAQRRGMIGINPINEVSKVNIPVLMVHGDVDRRVLYFNYKDYKKAMDAAGKTNAQYLTLEGADHFYNTLMYNHQEQFFTKMLDFLANDCGPGGL